MALTVETIRTFFADLKADGILPTLSKYYAQDAVLGEAGQAPAVGIEKITQNETYFANLFEGKPGIFDDIKIYNIAVTGHVAAIEHELVFTLKGPCPQGLPET